MFSLTFPGGYNTILVINTDYKTLLNAIIHYYWTWSTKYILPQQAKGFWSWS